MSRWLLALTLLSLGTSAAAQQITIAAAADLQYALQHIAQQYEAKTGTHVSFTFGSSGNLTTAIENGAPYDLFFSADEAYPRKLVADGRAESARLYQYAVGRLVLWAPAHSPIDVKQGLKVLTTGTVRKIAIANPTHAPYGRAAEEALRAAHVYAAVKDKLVLGENISQAAQFVASGNADVGLLALSLVIPHPGGGAPFAGKYWVIPASLYPPLKQAVVVLKTPHERAAQGFLQYVKSDEARKILEEYGFDAP